MLHRCKLTAHTGNQVRHCATRYKKTSLFSEQVCHLCLQFYKKTIRDHISI